VLRAVLTLAAGAVCIVVAVAIGALVYVSSTAGERQIATLAARVVRSAGLGQLELDGLEIDFPLAVRAKRISISAGDAEWLRIEGVAVRVGLLALTAGNLRFQSIAARALEVGRPPELDRSKNEEPSSFPRAIIIDALLLERIVLDGRIAGMTEAERIGPLRVDAAAVYRPLSSALDIDADLKFAPIRGVGPGHLLVDVRANPGAAVGEVTLTIDQALVADTVLADAQVRVTLTPDADSGTALSIAAEVAPTAVAPAFEFLLGPRVELTAQAALVADAPWLRNAVITVDGGAGVRAEATAGARSATRYTGRVGVEGDNLDWSQAAAQVVAALGDRFSFSSDVVFERDKSIAASNLDLHFGALTASGDAGVSLPDGAVFADVEGRFGDLSRLSEFLARDARGALEFAFVASGTTDSVVLAATASGAELSFEGTEIDALEAAADVSGLPGTAVIARATAHIGNDETMLAANVHVEQTVEGRLTFDAKLDEGDRSGVRVTGVIAADGSLSRALVEADLESFAGIGSLVGLDVGGSAVGDLRVDSDGIVGVIDAEALHLAVADIAVSALHVTAPVGGAGGFSADIDGLRYGGITLDRARIAATPSAEGWKIDVTCEDAHGAIDVRAGLSVRNGEHGLEARLAELSGTAAGRPVSLREPLVFEPGPDRSAHADGSVVVGDGYVDIDWFLFPGGSFGRVRAERFPLRYITPFIDETLWLDGSVAAEVYVSDPRIDGANAPSLKISVRGARAADTSADDLIAGLDLDVRLDQNPTDLAFGLVLTALGDEGIELSGTVTRSASLLPFGGVDSESVVTASFEGGLGHQAVEELAAIADLRLRAQMEADLRISGPIGDPTLRGELGLSDGRYDDASSGALLDDIDIRIDADSRGRARITVTARDEGSGRLRGTGTVDMSAGMLQPRVEAQLELDGVRAAQLDEANARVSGNVELYAAGDGVRVTGTLTTDELAVNLPKRLPIEITELKVVEYNTELLGRESRALAAAPPGPVVELDVVVEVPGPAFVRSKEMRTEWRGRIEVGGTSAAPTFGGELDLNRGDFEALGVRVVASKGRVRFDPSRAARHAIDLRGHIKRAGVDVTVIISGMLREPNVRLESEPPLPEDEILAFVLFGSSASSLTPLQAIQLAAAVASLASPRSAADPLGWFRDSTGLDRVDIVDAGASGDQSQYMLSAGKYVREGVFLSVEQPLGQGSSEVAVELEVSDRLTVKSSVGADSTGSVGAAWTLDY
jgi:translocation and assembly module TamB